GDVRRLVPRRADDELAVRALLEVDPEPAHRVVDGREDAHRVVVRILPDELVVDLEHPGELLREHVLRQVGDVEVDLELVLPALRVEHATVLVEALEKELAARDVARDEVAVTGVLVLEEVVALLLRNVASPPSLLRVPRDPHTSPFAP